MAMDIAQSFFRRMAAEGIKLDAGLFDTLLSAYMRQAEDTLRFYAADAAFNGLKYPRHEEENAVATFVRSIRIATKAFQEDPLWSPLISNWNRVESACRSFWMNCVRRCGRITSEQYPQAAFEAAVLVLPPRQPVAGRVYCLAGSVASAFAATSEIGAKELDLSQRDALLITYADQVRKAGEPPLKVLAEFCVRHLKGTVSGVHLLPFYPWSSDDGFSVKDFFAVEPSYGTWDDIARLGADFDLMFDAVFNHVSAQGEWFQRFLADDPHYRDFFISVAGSPDLSQVVRPRALPLLTEFSTAAGPKKVWTTFSADQVDLNFKNPEVLLAVLEALLFYVAEGGAVHPPGCHRVSLEGNRHDVPASAADASRSSNSCAPCWMKWRRMCCSSRRRTCRTRTTSPISATARTRRNWFITSRCRRWCCTPLRPATRRS